MYYVQCMSYVLCTCIMYVLCTMYVLCICPMYYVLCIMYVLCTCIVLLFSYHVVNVLLTISFSQEENIRRMNTSVKLNELIINKSHDAALVIVNLPGAPPNKQDEENCILTLHLVSKNSL